MPLVNLNLRFDLPDENPIVVYDRNEDEELIAYLQQPIAILILQILREREENEISGDIE